MINFNQIEERFTELKNCSKEYKSRYCQISEKSALEFIKLNSNIRPRIFCLDSGYIRLEWHSEDCDAQVGLTFINDQHVSYMFWKSFKTSDYTSSISQSEEIIDVISKNGLINLLRNESYAVL